MKIQELLEDLINTTRQNKKFSGAFKRHSDSAPPSAKELGHGFFSSVKNDPNDPHMVKKHGIKPSAEDAYNVFIEYLIDNDLMDNIHFPKVYDITKIQDRNGHTIHTYKIEKLINFNDASTKEAEAFIHRSFDDRATEMMARNNYGLLSAITMFFEDCLMDHPEYVGMITDDSLKEALRVIKAIEGQDRHIFSDIKSDNMMWRRTPHGLVLVFIDPVG